MGGVNDTRAERPSLDLIDDSCTQVLEALALSVLQRERGGFVPAALTDEERAELLDPIREQIAHHARTLGYLVRQAAALGEREVMAEMDRQGVERDILSVVSTRRRQ